MKIITIDELRKLEFLILKDVAKFCDTHNIRYYLAYGTMLGAVRHQGFIPWDDDIDIMMPRKDYEYFIQTYNESNPRYVVHAIENDEDYCYTMAKVYDKKTYLVDRTRLKQASDSGVFIDIFPIDGLPDATQDQNLIFKKLQWLNLLVHGSSMQYTVSRRYVDYIGHHKELLTMIRTVLKFGAITLMRPLSTRNLIKKLNKKAATHSFDDSNIVSVLVDCTRFNRRERLEKNRIILRKKYFFEGELFWGTADYDYYLTSMYKNYMQLPPEENQQPHHNFDAYWLE